MSGSDNDGISSCSHPSDVLVSDFVTGDEICGNCGLIMEERVPIASVAQHNIDWRDSLDPCGPDMWSIYAPTPKKVEKVEEHSRQALREKKLCDTIKFVCAKMFMESEDVMLTARCIYKDISKDDNESTLNKSKVAYVIWEALNRHGTPRSPRTIANYCEVPAKSILTMERKYNLHATYQGAHNYVETIGAFLEIPYFIHGLASELIERCDAYIQGRRPDAVAAVALHLICEKVNEDPDYRASLPKIRNWADRLGFSRRILQSIRKAFPQFQLQDKNGYRTTFNIILPEISNSFNTNM